MSLTRKPSAAYFAELKKYAALEQVRHAKGKPIAPISPEQVSLLTNGLEDWLGSRVQSAMPHVHPADRTVVARVNIFEPRSKTKRLIGFATRSFFTWPSSM